MPTETGVPRAGTLASTSFVFRIIHAALMASVLIYGVVLYVVTQQKQSEPPPTFEEQQVMFYGICGAAVAVLVAMVYPFGAVALLAMLIYAPRRALIEDVVRATIE